ncbi:TonB-dependent receptor plug domain-containing protein, partial [Zobellia galactanivorans]|nr:TonB-dependent receptor plug domain-containing protein [Zobellia galactanivorans]
MPPIEKEVFFETRSIQSTISGIVSDTNGQPVSGVTIQIGKTNKGTITGLDGAYTIQVAFDTHLIFSSIGYRTESIPIKGRTKINVILQESVTQLDEVVLNAGYYTVHEKKGTGNIAKMEAKTIEKQPVNNPLAALQGHISGVNIVQNTGVPGGGYTIDIRGQNFIGGGTEPLYIIDGVPYGSQSLASVSVSASINGGNISPLNAINPNDIQSIEVLKDADATAIYGARAANGVVLITTKKGNIG